MDYFSLPFTSCLVWSLRARRDLQAYKLNLFQLSRFIASEAVAKWRQIRMVFIALIRITSTFVTISVIVFKEHAGRFEDARNGGMSN